MRLRRVEGLTEAELDALDEETRQEIQRLFADRVPPQRTMPNRFGYDVAPRPSGFKYATETKPPAFKYGRPRR